MTTRKVQVANCQTGRKEYRECSPVENAAFDSPEAERTLAAMIKSEAELEICRAKTVALLERLRDGRSGVSTDQLRCAVVGLAELIGVLSPTSPATAREVRDAEKR